MRRERRIFLLLLAAAGSGMVLAGFPEEWKEMEIFQVDQVTVEGVVNLTAGEVRKHAAVPAYATIWDDPAPVARRVTEHPLVRDATVARRFPSTLTVEVREREPVAFVVDPVLEPVDREGVLLPLDPTDLPLDLPILHADSEEQPVEGENERAASPGVRVLAQEVARLADVDPTFWAQVSELALDPNGSVILTLTEPRVDLTYEPPLSAERIQMALRVLSDALDRHGERTPSQLDLRFSDQVVVRFTQPRGG